MYIYILPRRNVYIFFPIDKAIYKGYFTPFITGKGPTLQDSSSDLLHASWSIFSLRHSLGVSKNSGTPKWMVYNGKPF